MSAINDRGGVAEARQGSRWRFYRAVWRWHFYAGLLVLPFIIWLAVTGAAFLYQDAIDRSVHHGLKVVPIGDARLPAQQLVAAAQGRYGGSLFVYTTPKRADASAEIGLVDAHGMRRVAYVDPYRARVLGALPEHGTLSWTIRRLHSLALVGPYARGLIEMAGGWAIVLVLTGVYLWWPRGRRGGVISVRGKPKQRLFWRDLHAVTGAGVGAILLFLALTGMPWSWLWGAQVNRWANGHDFGYPAGLRVQQPMSQQRLADSGEPAWSLRQARLPESVVPAQRTGAVDEHAHGQQARALQMGDEHLSTPGTPGTERSQRTQRMQATKNTQRTLASRSTRTRQTTHMPITAIPLDSLRRDAARSVWTQRWRVSRHAASCRDIAWRRRVVRPGSIPRRCTRPICSGSG